MAYKEFRLENDLSVTIYKRKSSRHLRLSIGANGHVKVSIPTWAPYKTGLDFARSRQDWIASSRRQPALLSQGQAVGKAHHLDFAPSASATKPTGRIKGSLVAVTYPSYLDINSGDVQQAAIDTSIRALRSQAEQLLPQRLAHLAHKHRFKYKSVRVKLLKSRWGSCDQHTNIVLNLFLMQLPWDLIDYVLLHELAHTQVLRHGPDFWSAMEAVLPETKYKRKRLREYQPVLNNLI